MAYSGNFVDKSRIENDLGSCSIDSLGNTVTSSSLLSTGGLRAGNGQIIYGQNQNAIMKIDPPFGTDLPGKKLTISGGQGSGTGTGGDIELQTAEAGSTGSTVNTLTTKVIVKDDGKVGVNDTAPISELSVAGKIAITSEQTTPSAPSDGNGWLYTKSDGKIYWQSFDVAETDLTSGGGATDSISNANGSCEITANGNTYVSDFLGVGTNSPISALHLKSSVQRSPIIQLENNQGDTTDCFIRFGDSFENYSYSLGIDDTGNSLRISYNGSAYNGAQPGTTDRLVIRDNGNIGIGEDTPTEKLEVHPDSDNSAIIGKAKIGWVGYNNFAGFAHINQASTTNYALLQDVLGSVFLNAPTGDNIYFRINNNDKMRLSAAGNIAINEFTVTDPDNSKLYVKSPTDSLTSGTYRAPLILADNYNGSTQSSNRRTAFDGLGMFRWDDNTNTGDLRMNWRGYLGGASYYRDFRVFRGIKTNNDILICKGLEYNVGIRKYSTNGAFALDVGGNIQCVNLTQTSDDRIKYNEQTIAPGDALALIEQLTPKKYEKITDVGFKYGDWMPTDAEWPSVKDQWEWEYETGLVAQEVKQIPDLAYTVKGNEREILKKPTDDDQVEEIDSQNPLSLKYEDLFCYHIAATKALSEKINQLEARIQALESS